jgi:hypothetical protein
MFESMFNFIPYPNSTTPISQQFQDYENAKFFYTLGSPLGLVFITVAVLAGVLAIFAFHYRNKKVKDPNALVS